MTDGATYATMDLSIVQTKPVGYIYLRWMIHGGWGTRGSGMGIHSDDVPLLLDTLNDASTLSDGIAAQATTESWLIKHGYGTHAAAEDT